MWEEHEVPYDFRRYTSYGLKKLFKGSGFEIKNYKKIGAKNSFFFQLINVYLRKSMRNRIAYFTTIPLLFFKSSWFIL